MAAARRSGPQQGSLFDDPLPEAEEAAAIQHAAPVRSGAQAPSFVAFDVETANGSWGSICALGFAVVRNGVVVRSESLLCQPPQGLGHFDPGNIEIHGITPEDVARQPSFVERMEQFHEVIGDQQVVCHNARFDMTALREACGASGIGVPEISFGCTLVWSRIDLPGLVNYKLPTIAQHVGVPLDQHHDAAADALAAAGIALHLTGARKSRDIAAYAKATDTVLGSLSPHGLTLCASTRPTISWQGYQPSRKASEMPQPNPAADPGHPFHGQVVVVTGEFSRCSREALWDMIAERGGKPELNVTRRTTMLIKGTWVDSNGSPIETSKERKAREHIAAGRPITIIDESQLAGLLD
ncbi:exonuclease domain-containing protein [Lolliginicoccus suaedae]|uniref:exonuclease domain-containing protein n=1 Tax=Lolliginicoccus suaedae TaxID=2605429 RepID=UPI001659E06A|nr:exonuclease domain-containing protein [Lolliginicoccus suaedae]